MIKRWISGFLFLAALSTPVFADVNLTFGVEVAPPPPRVEVVPAPRPGYLWTPGYWAWDHGRHNWIEGRWVEARHGQYWVPERWNEYRDGRGSHYHFEPGHFEREHAHHYDHDRH